MTIATPNILSDFLAALGVRHTQQWTAKAVKSMSFPTLFGLSKLLQQCGVATQGVRLGVKSEINQLPTHFIAHTPGGFVIVSKIGNDTVSYQTQGVNEKIDRQEFIEAWDGVALLARPMPDAAEPDYTKHHVIEVANIVKRWMLWILAIALFAYLFISNGLYKQWSTILITIFDLGGLWLTYMLVQKLLHIKNAAADRVCGVLQAGGCDNILEMKASKFFDIFGWSEVGFAYFSVSLLTLLIFPEYTSYLAACNVCCLPFTCWSIWYQKFRAKIGARSAYACSAHSGCYSSATSAAVGSATCSRCAFNSSCWAQPTWLHFLLSTD